METLCEVKKNQVGTGLLIENDGHLSANVDLVQQIKEDIRNGHDYICPEKVILHGVFQKYGVVNANGRIYPKEVLVPAVEKYIRERVANHNAIGALDHPSESTLSGHDVAHNIIELHWEGSTLVGQTELHLSPGFIRYGIGSTSGDKVMMMLLDNILIGVSSRALGSVKQMPGGKLVVDQDLDIVGWDIVTEPSTGGAWLKFNKQDLAPFIESEKKIGTPLDEKIDNINKILK